MKKLIALLLALACLASLWVMPASAEGLDKETVQKAVLETAYAYYRKGMGIQYDSTEMTYQNRIKSGPARLCSGDSPEMAAADYTVYTVCSDWCYDVYYNAFGYKLAGSARNCLTFNMTPTPTSDPTVVLKFGLWMDDVHTRDRQQFIDKCQQVWEPGDVIVVYSRKEDGTQVGGHAMMYIGDTDGDGRTEIMHSGGSKVDFYTGVDSIDNPHRDERFNLEVGSVRIDDAYDHLFNPATAKGSAEVNAGNVGASSHNLTTNTFTEAILLRPRLDPNFPKAMTPSAQSRIKYPGLTIDRSTNFSFYNSVENGSEITVTVTVKNYGANPMTGLSVKEVAPKGAAIVEGSANEGGTASASGAAWTVDLAPGAEKKLTYKMKVTAKRGETVSLPGGTVDAIPTRDLSYTVRGKALDAAALTKVAADGKVAGIRNANRAESDFANEFYENVLDLDLGIPAKMDDVITALLEPVEVQDVSKTPDKKLLAPKAEDKLDATGKYLKSMILPEHLSGKSVYLGTNMDAMDARGRVREWKESAYQPGDVFLCLENTAYLSVDKPENVTVYIYLGDGKVAQQSSTGVQVVSYEASIARLFRANVMIALRPTLAYDDLSAKAKPFKFTDIKESAWYYSYVKSLVTKGVVSGMTETTFAPNGNLTYGQALKLVAKAVGESDQPAAGGHWAGGYLALAKKEGWLTGDVDLNANITRLQFCRIAAKAAKITKLPVRNPFTDCNDNAVLALYHAGIINGMSAAAFQPDGLLTRAQIAKIIFGLQMA